MQTCVRELKVGRIHFGYCYIIECQGFEFDVGNRELVEGYEQWSNVVVWASRRPVMLIIYRGFNVHVRGLLLERLLSSRLIFLMLHKPNQHNKAITTT